MATDPPRDWALRNTVMVTRWPSSLESTTE